MERRTSLSSFPLPWSAGQLVPYLPKEQEAKEDPPGLHQLPSAPQKLGTPWAGPSSPGLQPPAKTAARLLGTVNKALSTGPALAGD